MDIRVEVRTVSRVAYDHLYRMILAGEFLPGQWIKERQLTELLGISRTPVREALRMLEQERLVVSIPHRGFRVPIPTIKELEDFYELRAELEGMAARLAATRAAEADLSHLKSLWEAAQEGLRVGDATAMAESNDAFHHSLAQCTGNAELVSSLDRLRTGIDLYRNLSWSAQKGRPALTLEQHKRILTFVCQRNGPAAQDSARTHILDSLALAKQGLQSFHHQSGPNE